MNNSKPSDGVAKSWEDLEVRRKRLERYAVLCNGERFPSFSAAMKHFKIPDPSNKHIKIRGRLTSGKSPQETWIHEGREYVFKLAEPASTIESNLADAERHPLINSSLSVMNTPPLNQILYGRRNRTGARHWPLKVHLPLCSGRTREPAERRSLAKPSHPLSPQKKTPGCAGISLGW
ncbi:hypothetical protein [Cupriavidus metallidurans]|uniref:hypothetical protein n=1 Tax=Cupriavidus metallidurans TaxID=119219 RepID=UPI001267F7D7|nr:hypothetical protein [Cupriavidus metallidurans]